ncbi:hypothetical protein [Paenibacillus sp. MBLB4367]|uniref:hypothetical protein n=1 Tax=Paenibacillus sp. MBLB4367 TaxID=3384767 RepID=UPI00390809FF
MATKEAETPRTVPMLLHACKSEADTEPDFLKVSMLRQAGSQPGAVGIPCTYEAE